jgi:hypothetical protein
LRIAPAEGRRRRPQAGGLIGFLHPEPATAGDWERQSGAAHVPSDPSAPQTAPPARCRRGGVQFLLDFPEFVEHFAGVCTIRRLRGARGAWRAAGRSFSEIRAELWNTFRVLGAIRRLRRARAGTWAATSSWHRPRFPLPVWASIAPYVVYGGRRGRVEEGVRQTPFRPSEQPATKRTQIRAEKAHHEGHEGREGHKDRKVNRSRRGQRPHPRMRLTAPARAVTFACVPAAGGIGPRRPGVEVARPSWARGSRARCPCHVLWRLPWQV